MNFKLLLPAYLALAASAQQAVGTNDTDAVAPFEQAIKSGDLSRAQIDLETYTAQHPGSWRAQYQLGYVYFQQHKIQPSVARLCKSLVIYESFADSHKILAYDLNILGHPERAIAELERAIKLDPAGAESHYELGRLYYERGAYVQAIDHFERAKALAPESVRIYHNLGLAYAGVSDNARAIENFEEGLRRNHQQAKLSAWPLIDYGTYLNLQGDFGRAHTMLLEAVAIDGKWDQAFEELSKADRGLGDITGAIKALQHAIALNNAKPEYHYVLAQLYRQTRQYSEAEGELVAYRQVRSQGQGR